MQDQKTQGIKRTFILIREYKTCAYFLGRPACLRIGVLFFGVLVFSFCFCFVVVVFGGEGGVCFNQCRKTS